MTKAKDNEKFVYEQGVAELEEIVRQLSQGQVTLEESLKLYTRGVELANLCGKRLSEVEQTIKQINLQNGSEEQFIGNGDEEV